ncbi:hypothetical protein A9P82_02475 [Arachidicoccus ginsenosidimutans]|nr:hypothetical protein A9P82_02475 [Arachidicoccus sp. BS20]
MNDWFVKEIKKYLPEPELVPVHKHTIVESWHGKTADRPNENRKIQREIKELEQRLSYTMELLSGKQIAPEDYRKMSDDLKDKIARLAAKLSAINENEKNISGLLDKGIRNLLKLEVIYEMGDMDKKRRVIGSIFPEKFSFSESGDRTGRLNEAIRLIYTLDKDFSKNKNGTSKNFDYLSRQVVLSGVFTNNFVHDLKRLSGRREMSFAVKSKRKYRYKDQYK